MRLNEAMGMKYWVQWQVPVCAAVIAASSLAAIKLISTASVDECFLRSSHLWMPTSKKVNPFWLLGFRILCLLVLSWLLFQTVAVLGVAFAFYFYTQWTFSLVILYFLIASIISAHGCWVYSKNTRLDKEEKNSEENKAANSNSETSKTRRKVGLQNYVKDKRYDHKAGFWGYLMQVVYQTSAGAVVLTDIVFWGFLVPFLSGEHFQLDLLMVCMHSLNLVFLLIDTALNSLPFPWFRIAYFVLLSCIYICFQWVIHMCCFTWWPYPFLELSTPWAPLWYFSLALIHIPCYSLYRGVVKVKEFVIT